MDNKDLFTFTTNCYAHSKNEMNKEDFIQSVEHLLHKYKDSKEDLKTIEAVGANIIKSVKSKAFKSRKINNI